MDTLSATLIRDHRLFDSLEGDESEAVILYRVETPFVTMKGMHDDKDSDVRIKGPVYVGDDDMLDRHNELVDNDAIIEAWEGYRKNPVILYNHSKTYGVIGVMEDVQMGSFKKPDGTTVSVPIGVARIDNGEKDITRKIRKGMLRAFSIGFIAKAAVKECKDEDSCYMKFTDIEWLETSVVDVPASPGALFSVEKSLLSSDIANVDFSIDEVYDSNKYSQFEVKPKVHATVLRSEEKSCDGGSSCTCSSKKTSCTCQGDCTCVEEKHIVAIEEDDSNYYLTFGKADDMDDDMDDAGYHDDEEDLKSVISALVDRLSILEATLEAVEEKGLASDLLNTPVVSSNSSMTAEDIEITDDELEEKTILEDAEENPIEAVMPVEETVVKAEDEAEDEEVEEAAEEATEELVEEAAEDDLEEEVEEELEEKSDLPSTVEVLMQVVKALADMDQTVNNMSTMLDEQESLKTLLAEKDQTISSLMEEKATAEKEAEIEAEVSKRLADVVGDLPIALPKAKAARKSLVADETTPKKKTGVTKFDPQPNVSPGMVGLAGWLSARLEDRSGV
jgi:phage head maturation protease